MPEPTRHCNSLTAARRNFRVVLDSAGAGLVTTGDSGGDRFVVVPAAHQRNLLVELRPSNDQGVSEGGGWAVILPGLPVHGAADSFDEALDDAIGALREYAEDWNDRLHVTPNHAPHHVVVAIVELSDDEQVRDWLLEGALTAQRKASAGFSLAPALVPSTTSSASSRSGKRPATRAPAKSVVASSPTGARRRPATVEACLQPVDNDSHGPAAWRAVLWARLGELETRFGRAPGTTRGVIRPRRRQ